MEPGCGNRTGGLWYKNTGAVTTSPSRLLRDHASTEITGGSRLHLLVGVRVLGLTSSSASLFSIVLMLLGAVIRVSYA